MNTIKMEFTIDEIEWLLYEVLIKAEEQAKVEDRYPEALDIRSARQMWLRKALESGYEPF